MSSMETLRPAKKLRISSLGETEDEGEVEEESGRANSISSPGSFMDNVGEGGIDWNAGSFFALECCGSRSLELMLVCNTHVIYNAGMAIR